MAKVHYFLVLKRCSRLSTYKIKSNKKRLSLRLKRSLRSNRRLKRNRTKYNNVLQMLSYDTNNKSKRRLRLLPQRLKKRWLKTPLKLINNSVMSINSHSRS